MPRAISRCMEMGFTFRDWFFRRGGIVLGYTLLASLLCVTILILFENSEDDVFVSPLWMRGKREYCRAKGCRIFCKDVDWRDLRRHLENLAEDHCDSELEMSIQLAGFSEETIRTGWLKFLDQRVKTLLLRNYPLPFFGDSAFSGHPFTNLRVLIIANSRLKYLKRFWFADLPTLQDLQIIFEDACPVEDFWIEEGALEGITSLETLRINHCLTQPQHLLNLTGPNVKFMPKLAKINFSDNRLRFVPSRSFISAWNLKFLSLHDNLLQEIAHDALWPAPLSTLEISNNNLQNLSEKTFKDFDLKANSVKAFGNPWRCGCELQWLKDWYVKDGSTVNKIRPLLCADGRRFEDVDFGRCGKKQHKEFVRKYDNSCVATACSVTCTGTEYGSLVESINQVVECQRNLKLTLESVNFPNGKISIKWLQAISVDSVQTLYLGNCGFHTLDDAAFSGHPFENLLKLEMVNPEIEHIRRRWFYEIGSLATFELRFDVIPPGPRFWIERGSFENLRQLSTLQLLKCLSNEDDVRNVTGPEGGYMKELLSLDIRFNQLDTLSAKSFVNAPKMQLLFLTDNSLESIDVDAFVGTNLRKLDISGNVLKTIPEGVFRVFEKDNVENKSVNAFNNPWECDCRLVWFKSYYLKNNSFVDHNNPPRCNTGELFEDSDFQCEETTERTETSYGTTRELPPEEKLVSVRCRDINQNPLRPRGGAGREQVVDIAVLSNNHTIKIRFFDIDDDIITTEINMDGDVSNFHLLWFNSLNPNEQDCITYLHNRPIYLTDLRRTETYTFCLIYDGETSVSPYSCFGTTVPEIWHQRSWINNAQKTSAIATFASTVVLTAIVFSVSMFFIIRQNPGMIKGNKRVIVLGNREMSPCPPTPRVDSGYLTPNCPIYEKVQYRTGLRGAGENSISGYITTMENSYKIQKAPPLPPCHPVLSRCEPDVQRDDDNRNTSSA